MDTLSTTTLSNSDAVALETFLGLGVGVIITLSVMAVIAYILLVIAWWRIFAKAGEKGWKALIPIYNIYIVFKIFWETKIFWIIFAIALVAGVLGGALTAVNAVIPSIVTIVASIIFIVFDAKLCGRQSRSFGHGTGFTIGLFFLPVIFTLILGLSQDKYKELK